MVKKIVLGSVLLLAASLAWAAGGGHVHLDEAPVDLGDRASLQRGAKLFVNYCLSCHSASFMRYNRMGRDLGLSDDEVKENLMFAADKVGETMEVAMRPEDAERWFGVPAPDLSVIARARGADWLYTYLRAFYIDEKRPFGVNNLVFPEVAMPHVLADLQGLQAAEFDEHGGENGHETKEFRGFRQVVPGQLSAKEYNRAVADLVNFLVYLGEPAQLQRTALGKWVLLFLFIFTAVAYALKREYWKDVH